MKEIYKEVHQFLAEGKVLEAIVLLKHIVKRLPDNLEAHHDLIRLLLEIQNYEEAEQNIIQCLQINPEYKPVLFLKALLLFYKNQYLDSIIEFQRLIALGEYSSPIVLNIASIHRTLGQTDEGIKVLREYLAKQDGRAEDYSLLAELLLDKDETTQALEVLEQGLLNNSGDTYLLYLKAISFSREGLFLEAIPILQQILKLKPNYFPVMHELGYIYGEIKHYEGAFELLNKCIEQKPDSIPVLADLAINYFRTSDLNLALIYARKAEKMDPYNQEIHQLIKEILQEKQRKV